jgi:hypothetical protein
MEAKAFAGSAIAHIFVPRSVELIGAKCFASTQLLSCLNLNLTQDRSKLKTRHLPVPRFESFRFHGKLNFSENRALKAVDRLRFVGLNRFHASNAFRPRFFRTGA